MKRATKREKRRRRKLRKRALERCILETERKLEGRSEKPEEWTWEVGKDRTITLPPPKPGRQLIIKAEPGTTITVPGCGQLVMGSEPLTEKQVYDFFKDVFG